MRTSNWASLGALFVSVFSLAVTLVRWRSDKRRFAATDRRIDAQDDIGLLLELHVKLLQLAHAAREHLYGQVHREPTQEDVLRYRTEAEFLAKRSRWDDVRATAEGVLQSCEQVLKDRVRERPIEDRDAIRNGISRAMDAASDAIGARVDSLRAAHRPGRGSSTRSTTSS